MTPITERIKEHYAQGGTRRVGESFLNNLKRIFATYIYSRRRGRVLEWTLTTAVPDVPAPEIDIEIRRLTEEEIPRFRDLVRTEKEVLFRERLRDRKICLVAWHKGEVVWFGWLTTGRLSRGIEHEPVFDVDLRLGESEGYIFDAHTRPQYRDMNLHTYMSAQRLRVLKEMGVRRALGIAARHNVASRKAHQRGGAVEIKEVSTINVLGIKFHLWRDLKPLPAKE